VRGVLEIIHPLENDVRRVRDGMRSTFTLMGVISGFFLGTTVAAAFLMNWRHRRRFDKVTARVFSHVRRESRRTGKQ